MARDILSVQANSVASEAAFSISGRVLSIKRTRLTPTTLETCMCLKDHLDATDRIQRTSNVENSLDFEETILDEEVLANETFPLFDEEIALDETALEASCQVEMSVAWSGIARVHYGVVARADIVRTPSRAEPSAKRD
uniref:Zinc finger BED domain-containing protein RICESLEEPER 2 n=1 Tax=Tanacetum cinerariifolium TaxID=118510 RepID=A0A6L2MW89_TANCI|nr:zinc finger BED domain-containing protein RICESLEEPER 2 [Tanacetum cinerariifolium]